MKKFFVFLCVTFLLCTMGGQATATPLLTNPTPVVTYIGDTVTLHMELSGFPNYGVADNASDVLYTGDEGTWSFNISGLGITLEDYISATVTASLVLDDHYSVLTSSYSMDIVLDGNTEFSGNTDIIGLVHGEPYGDEFTNWTSGSFSASSLNDPFLVSMSNTSSSTNSGDWIAIDYLELTLTPVPEPATMLLLGAGFFGLLGLARKKFFKK